MWHSTPQQLRQMASEARRLADQPGRTPEERRLDEFLARNYERIANVKEEFGLGEGLPA
jgi:hypothetical protein